MTRSDAKDGTDVARYRFPPRDRTGWVLGLGPAQCLSVLGGLLVGIVVLQAGLPLAVASVALAVGLAFAFVPVAGAPTCEMAVVAGAYAVRAQARGAGSRRRQAAGVAAVLGGRRLTKVAPGAPLGGAGVVVDDAGRSVSATLAVRGREFALVPEAEQAQLLRLWGEVVGGFCTERSPVVRLSVAEWAAPQGLGEHLDHLDTHAHPGADSRAVADYRSLVSSAAPMATGHECLVTVTVGAARIGGRHASRDWAGPALEVLAEQMRLLEGRLDRAGLDPSAPLPAKALSEAINCRLAPGRRAGSDGARLRPGARSWVGRWRWVEAAGYFHACYWAAEWPRLEVGPGWMEPLVLHPGAPRTVTLVFEPVAPSRSARQVERDSVRVATDETQRARGGWRVGARQQRTRDEIAAREAQLVAGYPELAVWALVDVCGDDLASLERACAEYEQAAASSGLAMVRLDGRHDLGLTACLPLGVGLSPPVLS